MSNQVNLAVARPIAFDPTMRPPQQRPNPVLEGIRQEATEAAQRQEDAWYRVDGELACELRRLHASWLCYSEGNECLRVLCRVMTSVPSRTVPGDWLALAAKLGLSNTEIMSIVQKQSHVNMDSMQFVIWTYSQNTNANLYQIVNSLEALERYDALRMLREHFQQLVDGVNLLVEIDGENFIYERINPAEAGASAANLDEFLVAPKNYQRDIRRLLPLSLQNQAPARNTEIVVRRTNDNARPIAVQHEHLVTRQNTTNDETLSQPTATISPKIPKVNVFLTFAADGADFAERIAKKMRTAVGDRPEFGVLILQEGENAEKVLRNPEIIINQLFPQFHFICPILTLGYLKTINTPLIDSGNALDAQLELRSALDSLDACYVRFIHNLMMNEYTVNNCRNSRFRCIIPKVDDETQRQILAKMRQPGILNPTLRAWAYEKDLENFLRRLIGLY